MLRLHRWMLQQAGPETVLRRIVERAETMAMAARLTVRRPSTPGRMVTGSDSRHVQ